MEPSLISTACVLRNVVRCKVLVIVSKSQGRLVLAKGLRRAIVLIQTELVGWNIGKSGDQKGKEIGR